ncbi:MAG: PSD1 and planctomycete cytochrome C domain-containing protein [Planctomycetia bacterium]|nr:PSD1 and planctomycete cytochrome C domain-containing protein [Planctomycetia bacterium]
MRTPEVWAVADDTGVSGTVASTTPDFQRDIQPIFAEHCAHCHGIDAETRHGDLRLDLRDAAIAGGASGQPAIVPGKPAASELVARIHATDPDTVMPPPRENKPLSAEQKKLLEEWIAADAPYEAHWSFMPPTKRPVPKAPGATNPIDRFIRHALAVKQIAPAPPADEATLCRRLYLDLVGLPPSPEDLAAFQRDGYEQTVEKLLASPRYGEKWARHWLDLARYSDTNGYEKDMPREMWAWRDWVVAALNRDLPYDQFVVEQIAGDLLPDATQDQVVATGFLRNSMLNEEGAIIPEEFRMVEMFDRIDCVGKTVLGLTTQCAQCHSHKFDPLSHDEYYGLFAFLNDTYEARSYVYTPEQLRALAAIRAEVAAAEEEIRRQRPQWHQDMEAWAAGLAAQVPEWVPITMDEMQSKGQLTHPTQRADGSILVIGHRDSELFFECAPDLVGATGLQLEALNDGDLFMNGPGRDGGWAIGRLKVQVQRPGAKEWEDITLVNATADFSEAEQKVPRPAPNPKDAKPEDAKKSPTVTIGPVAAMIDGDEESAWRADRGRLLKHQPSVAVVQFEKPLDMPAGTRLKIGLKTYAGRPDMLGCCRFSLTKAPAPASPPVDHGAILAARKPPAERTDGDRAALFAAWRKTVPEIAPLNDKIAAAWAKAPAAPTTIMHLAVRPPAWHRPTHLLDRGVWNAPRHEVRPHVPAGLHPLAESADPPRLAFARWLVDPRSPLVGRIAVNRIWQTLFGTGLVETPDDFGTRAPVPEYRDLLDWLAVDFMEKGWSQKEAIRQIVMSDTYRQSAAATPEVLARDPNNRLLARGPRFRPAAEVVRDMVLAVSGLLTEKIGGPSVYPPVPKNVLEFNYTQIDWPEAKGSDRYRRSLYTFRRRSMPDPALGTFDAPTGDLSCARRLRSNTPLAALTGLNEPVFVEAAQALALRTLREGGADDASRLDRAFVLCTARPPTAEERGELLAFLGAQRKRLAEGWLDPRLIATGQPDKLPNGPAGTTPQDVAAWTLVSRVLLNLDETLTKN